MWASQRVVLSEGVPHNFINLGLLGAPKGHNLALYTGTNGPLYKYKWRKLNMLIYAGTHLDSQIGTHEEM